MDVDPIHMDADRSQPGLLANLLDPCDRELGPWRFQAALWRSCRGALCFEPGSIGI
jgi:hypothetical protein